MPAVIEETWYHLCIEVINDNNDTEFNEGYRAVNLCQSLSGNVPFS